MTHLLKKYIEQTPESARDTGAIAFLASLDHLLLHSPKIARSILQELEDQRSYLKLIASENYSSLAVQFAMGNLLTDKYAEGYPHHRFYAGCENVDEVEEEAANLCKEIFHCDHAYVQPHSGADANMVAFWSILVHRVQNSELEKLGKKNLESLSREEYEAIRQKMLNLKVMGLSLSSGGHLTHGYRHNVSAKMMRAVTYDVDPKTGLLNYDTIATQARKEKPDILLAGYSAYPRKINFAKMREIADEIGAVFMVDMAHFAGLVAGKVFQGEYDPVPFAHIVTSTTHKTLRGPRGGLVLCKSEYADVVNKGCPLVLGGPLPHVMAAKAVAFGEANSADFQEYAANIVKNAQAMAARLMERGATLLTNGTDNHLLIIDVSPYHITGRQAELALREAHITVNRNTIPFDQNGPWYTSGVRIGAPALTSLGMGTKEMKIVADCIADILENTAPIDETSKAKYTVAPSVLEKVQGRVRDLLQDFTLYPEININSLRGEKVYG